MPELRAGSSGRCLTCRVKGLIFAPALVLLVAVGACEPAPQPILFDLEPGVPACFRFTPAGDMVPVPCDPAPPVPEVST